MLVGGLSSGVNFNCIAVLHERCSIWATIVYVLMRHSAFNSQLCLLHRTIIRNLSKKT